MVAFLCVSHLLTVLFPPLNASIILTSKLTKTKQNKTNQNNKQTKNKQPSKQTNKQKPQTKTKQTNKQKQTNKKTPPGLWYIRSAFLCVGVNYLCLRVPVCFWLASLFLVCLFLCYYLLTLFVYTSVSTTQHKINNNNQIVQYCLKKNC